MHPVRRGDSPPQQKGNAWSPSSVVLDVPGYITLTGRQLLSLQMIHYLVQLPVYLFKFKDFTVHIEHWRKTAIANECELIRSGTCLLRPAKS